MRKEFSMTQDEMDGIIAINKNHDNGPLIALQCGMPKSLRQKIDEYWDSLGEKYGFDRTTVEPLSGLAFTAEATEPNLNTYKTEPMQAPDAMAEMGKELGR